MYKRSLITRPRAPADDLTQETFLAVFRNGFEDRSPAQTSAYLRTVARNRLLALRRSRKKATEVDFELAEEVWVETLGDAQMDDYLVALDDCLETAVTRRVRLALEMLYRDRLSRSEIAESAKGQDQHGYRAEFIQMVERAKALSQE